MRTIVGRLAHLPSAPQIYWDLTALLERDNVSLAKIAEVAERDPAMVAKLLQLVNSAYFGLARRVTSVEQAVTYLGVQLVKSLTLSLQVFGAKPALTSALSVDRLQQTSLCTGRVARRIAGTTATPKTPSRPVCCATSVGIILAASLPDQFARVEAVVRRQQAAARRGGGEIFGSTHADVGAYLLGVWGLPVAIIEAVAYHHEPRHAGPDSQSLVRAVHIADGLVEWASGGGADDKALSFLDVEFLEATGGVADLGKWCEFARTEVNVGAESALGVAS